LGNGFAGTPQTEPGFWDLGTEPFGNGTPLRKPAGTGLGTLTFGLGFPPGKHHTPFTGAHLTRKPFLGHNKLYLFPFFLWGFNTNPFFLPHQRGGQHTGLIFWVPSFHSKTGGLPHTTVLLTYWTPGLTFPYPTGGYGTERTGFGGTPKPTFLHHGRT